MSELLDETNADRLRARLEHGETTAADAIQILAVAAIEAPTRSARLDACRLLGDLAGRALGAEWEVAERAAFALLEAARVADTAADRRGVLEAMGHGFRNIWLLPFVHRRLSDRDPNVAAAALQAAGGLGFPALEEAVASFLGDRGSEHGPEKNPAQLRRAAIAALGRMGAMSAIDRLVPLVLGDPTEAAAALTALTEIRSPAGRESALIVLDHDLEPEVQIAAVRYLAELGALEVGPVLRRLARNDHAEVRIAATEASRALKAERSRDATERFLVALGEPDRAVRAILARRLRTLPTATVIEQAEVLFAEDPKGVVQILGELRDAEITRYLLTLAERPDLPSTVRARAVGAIEADQVWERAALAALAHQAEADEALRAAAVQAMGAFATSVELIDRIGDLASSAVPAIRGAVLWALQLASRTTEDSAAISRIVAPMLDDEDPLVRRRAAYVAGNLGLVELAAALVKRCAASEPADLRLAAYVALGELRMPGVAAQVASMTRSETDPRVLGAASNALVATVPDPGELASLAPRASQLLASPEARLREAGAEIAGLLGGAVPATTIAPLTTDEAPSVRAAAAWALGKLADPATEAALIAAFRDDDPAVHERAAAGLLRLGTPGALAQAIAFISSDGDAAARATLAAAMTISQAHAAELADDIDTALQRIDPDDPAFEPLLRMKLETMAPAADAPALDVDAAIAKEFPAFEQMSKLTGFDNFVRSLRTAEQLFQTTGSSANADLSPPITLWMKVLENYVHAWLGPRLATLQREPAALFDYVDRVIGGNWPGFQRWLEPKWRDPTEVGGAKVDVPLRAIPNAVRELQEHRRKRLDSPLSVTEWSRMMVLFAVDHPSGFKNLMKLGHKTPERTIALAHRLHTLAAVRNLVTHRASAGAATLAAFRRSYYAAFEELIGLA